MHKKLKDVIIIISFVMILHILNEYENGRGEKQILFIKLR